MSNLFATFLCAILGCLPSIEVEILPNVKVRQCPRCGYREQVTTSYPADDDDMPGDAWKV